MNDNLMYTGAFTSSTRGGDSAGGITVCRGNGEHWQRVQHIGKENPSFLCLNNKKDALYAIEGDGQRVYAFQISNKTKLLIPKGEALTRFWNGVACTVSPDDRFLLTASCRKDGGGLTAFSLKEDGSIGPVTDTVTLQGNPGPLSNHQLASKPHQIRFDPSGEFMLVADKGTDELCIFRLTDAGKFKFISSFPVRPGCCPRHLIFHPSLPYLYLLTEYFGSVVVFTWKNGSVIPCAVHPTLPSSFTGLSNLAGEIAVHPSGHWLYVSNRGHNSIVRFCIDSSGSLARPIWFTDNIIRTPRCITLSDDGEWLYCANQTGGCISIYRLNENNGTLSDMAASIKVNGSSSISFTVV